MTHIVKVPAANPAIPDPLLWLDYESTRAVRTITHELIGGGTAIVHSRSGMRRVRLRFLYAGEAESKTCEDEHAKGGRFRITETGRTTAAMTYVVAGDIRRTLDPDTQKRWIVEIDAQEVPA